MKYLTVESQSLADGTDASAMRAHETKSEALSDFYGVLSSGSVSDKVRSAFAAVVCTDGSLVRMETVDGAAPNDTGTADSAAQTDTETKAAD